MSMQRCAPLPVVTLLAHSLPIGIWRVRWMRMDKRLRPAPFPVGSDKRRNMIAHILRYTLHTYREAVAQIVARNMRARNTPLPGEKCEARTRRGTPCQCKAKANGRCRLHGGLSTGPKTMQGKRVSAANLPNAMHGNSKSFPTNNARARHGLRACDDRLK